MHKKPTTKNFLFPKGKMQKATRQSWTCEKLHPLFQLKHAILETSKVGRMHTKDDLVDWSCLECGHKYKGSRIDVLLKKVKQEKEFFCNKCQGQREALQGKRKKAQGSKKKENGFSQRWRKK